MRIAVSALINIQYRNEVNISALDKKPQKIEKYYPQASKKQGNVDKRSTVRQTNVQKKKKKK